MLKQKLFKLFCNCSDGVPVCETHYLPRYLSKLIRGILSQVCLLKFTAMRKKMRNNPWVREYIDGAQQYLKETTVHGFRYLANDRSCLEVIIWILVITTAFAFTVIQVHNSIRDSYTSPLMTSVETTQIQEVI